MSQVNRHQDSQGGGSGGGSSHFRSLGHLAGSASLAADAALEFPNYDGSKLAKSSRRGFMKLAGASMALAGVTLTGCRRWPAEELTPYSSTPRDRTPGVPEHYASAFELGGIATGLVVTTYDGRPIKVEGNPDHPFSLAFGGTGEAKAGQYGASSMFAQASVLEMYDPDRSRAVGEGKGAARKAAKLEEFVAAARAALTAGPVAFLSTATSSPSVLASWAALSRAYPNAKWYEYEALSADAEIEGVKLALGSAGRAVLDLSKAKTIVSIDADILGQHPAYLRYSADWSKFRKPEPGGEMNRMFVVETTFTGTGAVADERLPLKPSQVDIVLRAIAVALGVPGATTSLRLDSAPKSMTSFIEYAVRDLKAAGKAGVVAVGSHLSAQTQAVAHLINAHLGAIGTTVSYAELPERPTHLASITQLASELKSGTVKSVVVLSGNPAYDAPADLDLQSLIQSAGFSAYFGLYENETSKACGWHVPEAHYLESWGDARAYDGTVSLLQPMIEPMFGGKTKAELLSALAGGEASGKAIARAATTFADDAAYRAAIQRGVVEGTKYPTLVPKVGAFPAQPEVETPATTLEFRFVGSTVYDGRYANLGWLIELPDPMTRLTWDNALLVSATDAEGLLGKGADLVNANGSLVNVTIGSATLEIPLFILPGQPVGVAQLPLGWGRKEAGVIGTANGFNTYKLRTTAGFHSASGSAVKSAGSYELASTQEHYLTDWVGRSGYDVSIGAKNASGKIIREATFEEFKRDPKIIKPESKGLALQLWDPPKPLVKDPPDPRVNPHAWGMSIDMSACTGCGACVVACQAENNIPTVGKHQVLMHRAMHWIRIDRYYKVSKEDHEKVNDPQVVFMPMMCQHCENAPCEQVCPVAATVHDTEGLNTMVYNRCIGTRYCSNNCPYKVRRFNYFDYNSTSPRSGLRAPWLNIPDLQQRESIDPIRQLGFNPEVTVRMRGVMEKCTYCTQRIAGVKIRRRNAAQLEAGALKLEGEEHAKYVYENSKIADGSILTACQQACPTQAIWFGDISETGSLVLGRQSSPRAYDVLEDLNTRPRTKYLGKLRNPAVEPSFTAEEANG
jgi:molybdopterin-containing oxidoreductase family iron-sulfur binding subunit